MNKYVEHVYLIPEDDANRQVAVGFVDHHRVREQRIQVMPAAGGWLHVLEIFEGEYAQKLRGNTKAHVVMVIDFDGHFDQRRAKFEEAIPEEIRPRVFVVGSKGTPETLKAALKASLEGIGAFLAEDCDAGPAGHWGHEQLAHNDPDRRRLIQVVKPFLFW